MDSLHDITTTPTFQKIESLKKDIAENVFIRNQTQQIGTLVDPSAWIFDFRKILMNGRKTNLISDIFYDIYKDRYPFQLCTIEIAGVPLMTSLVTKFFYKGHEDINGFFLRKSRKKSGLMNMVEGSIKEGTKIILVDDIINSGNSFWRQVEVLEDLGYQVEEVWSILRYRELEYYSRFENRGIKISSLITLDDLTPFLGESVKNFKPKREEKPNMPFKTEWVFRSKNPSLNYVVPKSQPHLDNSKIYFGSDSRFFWALNQHDGSIAWSFKVGRDIKKKSIFSCPAMYENLIIFGSYDGNVYALDKNTGKKVWVNLEADWVGSSPEVAEDLGLVFIGLEFGLFKKHGGIMALEAKTGKTVWMDASHPAYTHGSPLYIKEGAYVAIGSNDGKVRLYEARKGKLLWEFTTFGGMAFDTESNAGFGKGDIKGSLVYDAKRKYLICGSYDGCLYILNLKTGSLVMHYQCGSAIVATPYICSDRVYFTSTDKHIRCVDLKTLAIIFEKNVDSTRIFSSPTIIQGRLYVGTNAGRLHELNPDTGESLAYYQTRERITNTIVYNKDTDTYFLPTYANEIICMKREDEFTLPKKNNSYS